MKKKKAKRLKFDTPKKTIKRIKKTKRSKPQPKSPFKITIRDWGAEPYKEHKVIDINESSVLEIRIDENIYSVKIDKEHRCLQFSTHGHHLFLQPISVHQFLVKSKNKNK